MERRASIRIPLYLNCNLFDTRCGVEYEATVCDISEGGVCIAVADDHDLVVNSQCAIQFIDTVGNYEYIITESVTISNISKTAYGSRIGATFTELSEKCRSYLRMLYAKSFAGR